MYTIRANSCNWCASVVLLLVLFNIVLRSYYVSKALISPQRLYEQVQCCQHFSLSSIMMSRSKLGVPQRLATVPCMGSTLANVKGSCY